MNNNVIIDLNGDVHALVAAWSYGTDSSSGLPAPIGVKDNAAQVISENSLQHIGKNPLWIQGDGVSFYSSLVPLAPHANALRSQYIVPANRRARVMSITMNMTRVTAETTVVKTFMNFQITPVDGSGTFNTIQIGVPLFGVGAQRICDLKLDWPLVAGDKIEFETVDVAVGGTVDYTFSAAIIEYDA